MNEEATSMNVRNSSPLPSRKKSFMVWGRSEWSAMTFLAQTQNGTL